MRGLVDRGFDRLAAIEGRYLAIGFFAILLVYTAALVLEAVDYSEAARLFPLIVGIPLVVMLLANILLLAMGDRVDLQVVGFFDAMGEIDTVSTRDAVPQAERYRREVTMILWVGAFVLLTWLVGNLAAIFVFVFAFIAVHERAPARAFFIAAVTIGFIYLLFVRLLGATLWRGVFPIGGLLP